MSNAALEMGAEGGREPAVYSSTDLLPIIYTELRRVAAEKLRRERRGHTLTPTALVHEAYLRLTASGVLGSGCECLPDQHTEADEASGTRQSGERSWRGKRHFLAAASQAMRRILVDQARRRRTQKHGLNRRREALRESHIGQPAPDLDLLALDEALNDFEKVHPAKAELVKLHNFAGLSLPETADALAISRATAERWWAFARAWLFDRLKDSSNENREEIQ
jgi:RNA polymerase sigma factor (sigma-70 family)